MDNKTKDIRLLVRCSQMYYEDGLNQAQISKKLGISKSSISRILNSAKEEGIIKISVLNPLPNKYIYLEKGLEKKFGLKEVIVVDSKSNEPREIKQELAKASAEYLERVIKDDDIIGVTWGTTIKEITKYVKNNRRNKVTFIPLLGGLGQSNIDIHSNQIALELAKKFKADSRLLHAPCIIDDPERKKMFIEDKNIQTFLKLLEKVNIAITGIGSPQLNTSTMLATGYYSKKQIENLVQEGAVADISSLFIDKFGQGDSFENNNRVIGVTLNQIKNIPLTIGVAGHEKKTKAILAALRGGYIDVLIVDDKTAQGILNLDNFDD